MAILAQPVREMTGARPASRGVNYPLLAAVFLGLAIAKLATVYLEMEQRAQKALFGSEGCTRYREIMSPEDIVPVFEGVFVTSSDERRQHMMRSIGVEAAPWGDLFVIWNVDTPGKDPKVARLELEGFPENTAFHPHGMHYRRETGELFVINHAYSQGGERIDVFKVSENFPQDALPETHPSLLEGSPRPVAGEGSPQLVDIGIARAELGSVADDSAEAAANAGAGEACVDQDAAGNDEEEEDASEGEESTSEDPAGDEGDSSGNASQESTDDGAAAEGVEEEPEEETVEEVVETTKEKEKRLKREAKEAAAREKAEARAKLAEEKAAAKAAAARRSARTRGLSRGVVPLKLTYSFSVEHEHINGAYGVLNDLVLASDDELYVTQYLTMRHPLHGPTQPDGVLDMLRVYLNILLLLIQWSPAPIIRCTGIRGDDIACEYLAQGRGVMYNGIALSPDRERLLVSDTTAMQMVVFNRSLETGALTLRQRLDLPGSPDNLEIDPYRAGGGEEAYTVGLIRSWHFFAYFTAMDRATKPSDGDKIKMAGGMASLVFDKQSGRYTSSLEMWQDGSLLSIASAAATASGSRLLGSAVEEGFLLCRPPPCPPGSETTEKGCTAWGPPSPPPSS